MNEFVNEILLDPVVGKLVALAIGLLIINVLVRFIQSSLNSRISNSEARYRVRKFVNFLGYLAIAIFITVVFSDRLGGLTVAFGVAGAGIAFALQEVIASIAGWVALSFGGFFKVGDRVQLGGIKGDVIDIGILRTTVMECGQWVNGDLYNGRIVRIANSFVFKEPVFNYSADFPFLWDEIMVPVKYGSDRRLAKQLLSEAISQVVGEYTSQVEDSWNRTKQKYLIEQAQIEPIVTLIANDNWLEYTVRYVVDYRRRRGTKDRLFNLVLDEIEKSDGRVALASATFHLVETPTLNVRLANGNEIKTG